MVWKAGLECLEICGQRRHPWPYLLEKFLFSNPECFDVIDSTHTDTTPFPTPKLMFITPTALCMEKPVRRNCKKTPENRWFYKKDTQSCGIFTYTGCDVNRNNFETEEMCMQTCASMLTAESAGYLHLSPFSTFFRANNQRFAVLLTCQSRRRDWEGRLQSNSLEARSLQRHMRRRIPLEVQIHNRKLLWQGR